MGSPLSPLHSLLCQRADATMLKLAPLCQMMVITTQKLIHLYHLPGFIMLKLIPLCLVKVTASPKRTLFCPMKIWAPPKLAHLCSLIVSTSPTRAAGLQETYRATRRRLLTSTRLPARSRFGKGRQSR